MKIKIFFTLGFCFLANAVMAGGVSCVLKLDQKNPVVQALSDVEGSLVKELPEVTLCRDNQEEGPPDEDHVSCASLGDKIPHENGEDTRAALEKFYREKMAVLQKLEMDGKAGLSEKKNIFVPIRGKNLETVLKDGSETVSEPYSLIVLREVGDDQAQEKVTLVSKILEDLNQGGHGEIVGEDVVCTYEGEKPVEENKNSVGEEPANLEPQENQETPRPDLSEGPGIQLSSLTQGKGPETPHPTIKDNIKERLATVIDTLQAIEKDLTKTDSEVATQDKTAEIDKTNSNEQTVAQGDLKTSLPQQGSSLGNDLGTTQSVALTQKLEGDVVKEKEEDYVPLPPLKPDQDVADKPAGQDSPERSPNNENQENEAEPF